MFIFGGILFVLSLLEFLKDLSKGELNLGLLLTMIYIMLTISK